MFYVVIYLFVTLWLIHYVTKEIRNCPYCGRKMKSKLSEFGVVWECKCGSVIWEIKK